jgi:hypothetical protein
MTIKSLVAAASTALVLAAGTAAASPLRASDVVGTFTGDFFVTAVNVVGLSGTESQATMENFNAARAGTLGVGGAGPASVQYAIDTFEYSGALKFGTSAGSSTTISQFLNSAGGTLTDLDLAFGQLTNSNGNIGSSTATTTFYLFEAIAAGYTAGTLHIAHDDGILVLGAGGTAGPTQEVLTSVAFGGGALSFLYVSTNSDPSVFRVDSDDVSAVPLPAAAWMLLAGLGAIGAVARRRKAA